MGLAGSIFAYSATVSAAEIEEIMVTATKRAQSAQSVPITISAFGGEQLKELGVSDVVDVAANVPNVQVNYGLGNNFFNIRGQGINEFVANLDSPVAVHVDEVYQSKGFMTGMVLFDVERVEVLKGPQGDLFGRNTTGGAVNFITRKPEAEFGAGGTVGYGNYNTFKAEGYVTGALSDNMNGRLSGYVINQGTGFYKNLLRGDTEGRVKEWALRGQLEGEFGETTILASFHYGQDRSQLHPYEGVGNTDPATGGLCAQYLNGTVSGADANCLRGLDLIFNPGAATIDQFPGDDDPYTVRNNLTFEVRNRSLGGQIRIDHDLGSSIFTSISAYERFDQDQREDSDESPIDSVQVFWYTEFDQFTQEFRLTSDFDDANWSYVLGAFYEHDNLDNGDYLTAYLPFNGLNNYSKYNQKVDAVSGFFHAEFQVSNSLRMISGVRYTRETTTLLGGTFAGQGLANFEGGEERPEIIGAALSHSSLFTGSFDPNRSDSRTDENVSFKSGVQWEPNEDIMIYANVSTGFRSGGYSVAFATTQTQLAKLAPETITAYEIGFKSDLMDNSLRINGAIFNYDIRDAQIDVDVQSVPVPITVNAGRVRTTGAELDITWAPVEGLEITSGLGWLDTEIREISDEVRNNFDLGAELEGNRPAFSPKWTYNGRVRYQTAVTDDLNLVLSTDWNWRSEAFLEVNNQPSNLRPAYWIVNARASLESYNGNWRISIWGKNITGTNYVTYLNDLPAFGWLLRGYGDPTTYGLSVEYNF